MCMSATSPKKTGASKHARRQSQAMVAVRLAQHHHHVIIIMLLRDDASIIIIFIIMLLRADAKARGRRTCMGSTCLGQPMHMSLEKAWAKSRKKSASSLAYISAYCLKPCQEEKNQRTKGKENKKKKGGLFCQRNVFGLDNAVTNRVQVTCCAVTTEVGQASPRPAAIHSPSRRSSNTLITSFLDTHNLFSSLITSSLDTHNLFSRRSPNSSREHASTQ